MCFLISLPPSFSLQVSLVYESIDDTKSYGDLQRASSSSSTTTTTPFFLEFVQWCVDEYRVGGLLEHALSHGRTREASMLVNMLHSKHPTSSLKKKWNDVVARGEHEMEGGMMLYTARGLGVDASVLSRYEKIEK